MKNTKAHKTMAIVWSIINPVVWIMAVVMGVVGFFVFFAETFKDNPFNQFMLSRDPGKQEEQTPKPAERRAEAPPGPGYAVAYNSEDEDDDCTCALCKARRSGKVHQYLGGVSVVTPEMAQNREKIAVDAQDFEQADFWKAIGEKFKQMRGENGSN